MKTYLRPVRLFDYDKLMELFIDCFMDDPYYKKIYPDDKVRHDKMVTDFGEVFKYCIQHNWVGSIWSDKDMLGFLIGFDYWYTRKNDKSIFNLMFTGNMEDSNYQSTSEIHNKICNLHGDTMYLIDIGIRKDHRKEGLATELIKDALNKYYNYNVVADIDNMCYMSLYEKLGFDISDLGENYKFVQYKVH